MYGIVGIIIGLISFASFYFLIRTLDLKYAGNIGEPPEIVKRMMLLFIATASSFIIGLLWFFVGIIILIVFVVYLLAKSMDKDLPWKISIKFGGKHDSLGNSSSNNKE